MPSRPAKQKPPLPAIIAKKQFPRSSSLYAQVTVGARQSMASRDVSVAIGAAPGRYAVAAFGTPGSGGGTFMLKWSPPVGLFCPKDPVTITLRDTTSRQQVRPDPRGLEYPYSFVDDYAGA